MLKSYNTKLTVQHKNRNLHLSFIKALKLKSFTQYTNNIHECVYINESFDINGQCISS